MTRRTRSEQSHAISGVFVFLLLGVFAVFSTVLVLFGAQAYRATTDRTDAHGSDRTIYSYLLNTVRGDDEQGIVRMRSEGGVDALAVAYNYGGEPYEKRVYCYDGYLRELLIPADYEFDPAEGEPITEAQSFRVEMNGSLLTLQVVDGDGELHTVDAVLRSMT